MEEKKIATSVDILINVDRFEHLQITKYSEKKITYSTQEEMIQKEDQLTNELMQDVIRTMRSTPSAFKAMTAEKLEKIETTTKAMEDKISKKIPSWLEEGGIPNIANAAQANATKAVAEAHAKQEDLKQDAKVQKAASEADTEAFLNGTPEVVAPKVEPKPVVNNDLDLDEDLFADDEDLFK